MPVACAALGGLLTVAVLGTLGIFDTDEATPSDTAQPGPKPSELERIASLLEPSIVAVLVDAPGGRRQASGLVLDADGLVLTSARTVARAQEILVVTAGGDTVGARLRGRDVVTNLAVIDTGRPLAAPAALNRPTDELDPGDEAVVAGARADGNPSLRSVTISGTDADLVEEPGPATSGLYAARTKAPPEATGGALIGEDGALAGVIVAAGPGRERTVAVPVDVVERVVRELVRRGWVDHGWTGIRPDALASGATGPRIARLDRGSPAERAGLRVGDVVIRVGQRETRSRVAVVAELESAWPGDRVRITVLRQATLRRIVLAVAPRPVS